MLLRASEIFRRLTIGRYAALRIDSDGPNSRLLGLRDDGRTVVDVGAMSEGTTDQLFLALRLAAVEQSIAAGVRLPFLADALFEIGRAHVCTPVTNAHLVCRFPLDTKQKCTDTTLSHSITNCIPMTSAPSNHT